ncbi:E3 ubiquitin-protein ligase RNF14-like isoform X1 [Bombus affinis]|uniref:E3 ubiquitin-protein ligase RNF14-like isoform X1 n=1 Tax=Bombus affinis TaxID=309941 RepID=UPI0021B76D3F|nr:E3 ubiquitin-protein ligase RNF14-like isoform X1 [Bombus affinis]
MSRYTINNQKRQEDEVLAISNIYSNNEFSYSKKDIIHCHYYVFVNDSGDLLKLENVPKQNFDSFYLYFIKYLPPIRMYLQLNVDYPTEKSPNFYIISSWLSPWQISFICQKLDEIWLENRGQEILFLWFEFLRNDILKFLNIKDTLDISFMYMTYHNISDYFKLNSIFQNDIRAIYSILFYDPLQFLLSYNKYTEEIKFQNSYFECVICFGKFCGRQCIKLKNCGHIYCENCMQEYVIIKIKEDNVIGINCPDLSCNLNITINEVKRLCPELFSQYEEALLRVTLSTMKDVILCPRISCQCPSVKTYDDTLGICSKCDYTFCTYCYKVYHGVEPCAMSLSNRLKLIEEYQNGNKDKKRQLEAKYGRKQIQKVAEEYLTQEYLKKNTKACPNCATMVEKIDGCNKMTCNYCQACFCWLCGMHITTKNPYDHFLVGNSNCYQNLYT